jgi:hypothetical protein
VNVRRVCAALAALALLVRGAGTLARAAGVAQDPACGVVALTRSAGGDRWFLPHGFVRTGSDSVWTTRRGPLVRNRDYVLDALRGELRLLSPPAPGETLWVASCWLLAPPPLEFSRHRFQPLPVDVPAGPAPDTAGAARLRPATGRDLAAPPGGASLAVTGNKTIAVEFGSSQDAALRQSLDLAVAGTLAPGVELTGVLSDRNTPLTVAGSTQDLQALDRVLIELRAPHASAALGDVPLTVNQGQFARLDRQVQGMRGEWHQGGFTGSVAAASAQGEYMRLQLAGADGLQGPYTLTDREGGSAITVVAGSEVVTLDGQKLARGESADYSMDYERARLTFTNRRPISSSSRITVEYQYALHRYRRNMAAFSGEWRGTRGRLYSAAVTESDDRGRPLDGTLDAADLAAIAAAGDSAGLAMGPGLVAGGGDYDTVRVALDATRTVLVVAFAGPDSGRFAARFARVAQGAGDYADSAIVAGRTIRRWVGPGRGAYVLGRALPLPETRRLLSLGGTGTLGALVLDAEGALTHRDLNAASARDDGDDAGAAGRVSLTLEGRAGALPGRAGVQVAARSVDRRFSPFSRLERAFAEEDWGLPAGADLDHQRRADAVVYWKPRAGTDLRADVARLETPDGYAGTRRAAEWTSGGPLRTHALWLDTDGSLAPARFAAAGRRHLLADAAWAGRWVAPSLRAEHDERRTPGDSAAVRDRAGEVAGELATGSALRWRLRVGMGGRFDRHESGLPATELRTNTWRAGAESPQGGAFGVSASAQRRIARDVATGTRSLSDLASVRLRGERRPWGLSGLLDVELTGEADNRRLRTLTYVGPGRGAYDALGNFTGTGDYELLLVVSPELERYARLATSARAAWQFGSGEAWRGSRLEVTFEDEARRRGGPRASDVFLGAGPALTDAALLRGTLTQRLESELAPGSRVAALHVRAERRVSADRSYGNFTQLSDQRTGSLRWRSRPASAFTVETQAQLQWQRVAQNVTSGAGYARTLSGQNVSAQLAWQPGPALRAAGALELDLSRPEGATAATRTVRVGPDLGANVGKRGRAELTLRRAFVSGPAAVGLLPSVDPAGFARWDGTARFDLRLHETTTFGVSGNVRERPGRAAVVNGRAEVRAFF